MTRCRISIVGESVSSGIVDLNEQEMKTLHKIWSCIGQEREDAYAPTMYYEEVQEMINDKKEVD